MRKPTWPSLPAIALLVALLSLLAAGCAPPETPWKVDPVWLPDEEAHYEIRTGDTLVTGEMTATFEKTADGWILRQSTSRRGSLERSEVVLDAALSPRSSWREASGSRSDATYADGKVTVSRKPPGGLPATETTLSVSGPVVDNEASLMVYRGLRLGEGARTTSTTVVPKSAASVEITAEVGPVEKVAVPAGSFEVRCLSLRGAGAAQRACYATAAPHALVSYENPTAHISFLLRAHRPGKGAAWQGDPTQPLISREPVPVRWSLVIVTALVSLPIMLVFPLWLGMRFKKRFGTNLALWGAGALTFVASQVVHIPLNYAAGLMGGGRGLGLLPQPYLALALGLSAGLCEEIARYVAWRWALTKRGRTYHEALQFGAGHGGIEAMIVGVVAILQVGSMLVISFLPLSTLGVPPESAGVAETQRDAFWLTPAYHGALGGAERLFAMAIHIACSVLVVRAVARRQPVWLLAAIALHTAVDAALVFVVARWGAVPAELGAALFGLFSLFVIWQLREPARAGAPVEERT